MVLKSFQVFYFDPTESSYMYMKIFFLFENNFSNNFYATIKIQIFHILIKLLDFSVFNKFKNFKFYVGDCQKIATVRWLVLLMINPPLKDLLVHQVVSQVVGQLMPSGWETNSPCNLATISPSFWETSSQ